MISKLLELSILLLALVQASSLRSLPNRATTMLRARQFTKMYGNAVDDPKERTAIPTKDNLNSSKRDESALSKYFVPGFVLIWAVGYSLLFAADKKDGLGDSGGYLATAGTIVLFLALFAAAIFESFKSEDGGFDDD